MQLQGVRNVIQVFFFDIVLRVAVFLHTLHIEKEILKVMIHISHPIARHRTSPCLQNGQIEP